MAHNLKYLIELKSGVMKTIKMKMVSLFFIFGFLLISLCSNSQDIKLSRQERKEARKAIMAANFSILDSLLSAKSFVLEADYLQDKMGNIMPVVSTLNFIKVDGSKGILQTGSSSGQGYNTLGGVTAVGTVGEWKITKEFKSLSYSLRFNLVTEIGNYDIFMTVYSDNNASATISGSGPGKLTWKGHLETLDNARIFKGQDTF
jgi:hypothetical protein